MKSNYLLIWFLIIAGCKNQSADPPAQIHTDSIKSSVKVDEFALRTDEDSIKFDYKISDSITLIKKVHINSEPQYAFIVHNRNTLFHKNLSSLFAELNKWQAEAYVEHYNLKKSEYQDSIFTSSDQYRDLIGKWIPVYWYKDAPYVFKPCEFYLHYQLTDSTFISYDMDGPLPELILKVAKSKDETILNTTGPIIRFKLVDPEKSIYLFMDGSEKKYLIPLSKVNELPIIVEHCTMDGVNLIDFDPIP